MIQIDTEQITALARAAGSASQEMSEAAQILSQVTTHNDWGCKERNMINDYIQKNKKMMGQVMESSQSFTAVLSDTARRFVEAEKGISALFDTVEGLLKQVIGVPVRSSIVRAIPDAVSAVSSRGGSRKISPISIVDFSAIDANFSKK